MTEESKVKARWAGYFERLYQADPPTELDVRGVTIPIADPPINCDPPSFVETKAAVNQLKWSKAPDREGQKELHCVFVDLETAYDRVPREELWHCMRTQPRLRV